MKKLLILIGVLAIMFVGGCSESADSNNEKVATNANTNNNEQKQEKETKKKETKSKLTLDKFNKVQTNMSYKEVVKILGSKGKVLSESEVGGIKTVMYQWDGSFGANMNAMFQKDKLISKAQFGLE